MGVKIPIAVVESYGKRILWQCSRAHHAYRFIEFKDGVVPGKITHLPREVRGLDKFPAIIVNTPVSALRDPVIE